MYYDLDGNQTLVKTSTGIWAVEYNAENRPVRWTQGNKVVTMDFDRMGRRIFYKEMEGDTQTTYTKFVYKGYLCVQQVFSNEPWEMYKEFIWDPTEPTATRPLCFRPHGQYAMFFTHDGNKNVSDLITVGPFNTVVAHYDYAPFGAVSSQTGNWAADNPLRFSSEFHDDTLGLVYYNYRHYNPTDARWLGRDPIESSLNLLTFIRNTPCTFIDHLGLLSSSLDLCKCTYTLTFNVVILISSYPSMESLLGSLSYPIDIESVFNKNTFTINSDNERIANCCPQGLKPLVKVDTFVRDFSDTGESQYDEDFTLIIYEGEKGDSRANTTPDGLMTIWSSDMTSKRTLAHEFGHALGLHHPGYGVKDSKTGDLLYAANSAQEYTYQGYDINGNVVTPNDLMGIGTALRTFYFAKWEEMLKNENP